MSVARSYFPGNCEDNFRNFHDYFQFNYFEVTHGNALYVLKRSISYNAVLQSRLKILNTFSFRETYEGLSVDWKNSYDVIESGFLNGCRAQNSFVQDCTNRDKIVGKDCRVLPHISI